MSFGVCEQCGDRMVARIGWDVICEECEEENREEEIVDLYEDDLPAASVGGGGDEA